MNALSNEFARQLSTNPDATYSVMITLNPNTPSKASFATHESMDVQPVEGLDGIYKATLSGREILKLQQDDSIQAIEPDDLNFYALG
jgi:hypothetical protein